MKTLLTIKKHLFKNNEYIVRECSGNKQYEFNFSDHDELINYLKNNVPVSDRNYEVDIDNELDSNKKLLLKHSTEQAARYQKDKGFDKKTFEYKQKLVDTSADENDEDKTDKILDITKRYYTDSKNNNKPVDKVFLQIMAEYAINEYENKFVVDDKNNQDSLPNINIKTINNLKSTFNFLINNDYTEHTYRGTIVSLIPLRNKLAKLELSKQKK